MWRQIASVLGPFKWHSNVVESVTFFLDDKHIVSATRNFNICVWDTGMGDGVGLFTGH
jgi:WD40 repeat protein